MKRKYKLTDFMKKKGYKWRCPKCGKKSRYAESICEKCYGEDA